MTLIEAHYTWSDKPTNRHAKTSVDVLLCSLLPAALWFKEGLISWGQTMEPWLIEKDRKN